ncbi:MAG: hypothetical protein LBJ41_02650 [Treponema sp.]|jgi:hypothetical protein|nr:hypothetical protein [Treponema sp.]
MKKALAMGGAALVAFALMFSACDNAYDVTTSEVIPSLSGPGNLNAVNDQKGVITLTWDRVYDASGYAVYRKAANEPEFLLSTLGTNWRELRYDDVVSDTNLLKEGVAYTYTVFALSGTSTSVARGVDVVQHGSSTTTITPSATAPSVGIPAKAATGVVTPVTGLTVDASVRDTNKVVAISWNRNPNRGVNYKVEFNGQSATSNQQNAPISFTDDGKVLYTYWSPNNLVDGEKYTVKVTAFYSNDYYVAAAPVAATYTHSAPASIIQQQSLSLSPITLYNTTPYAASGHYNVSAYWYQSQKAPTGVTYKLYRHEGNIQNSPTFDWDEVTGLTIPSADATGLVQVTLSGNNRPAYRQNWTYKVVAIVGGEVVDSATASLTQGAWAASANNVLQSNGWTATGGSKKVTISVNQITGLYGDDSIEFFAILSSRYNDTGTQWTESDQILTQAISLGTLGKAALEDSDADKRKLSDKPLGIAGQYTVIAVLKNDGASILQSGSNNVTITN